MTNTGFYPKVNSKVFPIKRVPVAGIKPLTIIANKLPSGSANSNTLYENIKDNSINTLFGENSNLARAIKTAFKIDGKRIINAIPLDENVSDTAATATIAFSGTIAKTKQVVVKSEKDIFSVGVNSGASLTILATNLNNAINSATSKRFTSSVSASTLTLSALCKGICGNSIPLEIYFLDENGARINEITLTFSGFSGGLGVPSITNALSVLSEFDTEVAIDTSFALDVSNLSAIKNFFASRLNSDNVIKNGFCFLHYVDSLSGLTEKFGNNAFGDCPLIVVSSSKSVSKTGKSGSEDGNYPLDVAVGISCINSAIVTNGSDVYAIMPHSPIGTITNQGVARGGMILPNFSISNDPSESWTSAGINSEIASLESLKINSVCTRNGNLEIGEMFTQSTEESYQSFPEMSIVTRVQSDVFLKMKQYKNKIINDRITKSIRGNLINYISEISSPSHDFLSDNEKDIDNMIKSIKIERVEENPNAARVTFMIKTVNSLKFIPVNIFVNTLNL